MSVEREGRRASVDGLVVVDKPSGWTSHDVVGKVRGLAGTRKVGHAGTLDPMATGVLICGVGRATRLLGYLTGHDKAYRATIRLGQSTVTDDAEGELIGEATSADVDEETVRRTLAQFVGEIKQIPSSVSAVKVDGKRAYARVRAGEEVTLEPRIVTISELEVRSVTRPAPDLLDVDISVACSSGTYVRAIARDLGAALGVGGHVTELRRTRIGEIGINVARSIDQLEESFEVLALAEAVRASFPSRKMSADESDAVRHGRLIERHGEQGVIGAFDDDGRVLALMEPRDASLRVVVGFTGSS
ncbi:MAG: tRNA pseudouridine(55) synthase TruB [Actinomycetes bacterium]